VVWAVTAWSHRVGWANQLPFAMNTINKTLHVHITHNRLEICQFTWDQILPLIGLVIPSKRQLILWIIVDNLRILIQENPK
jgi:hypothetical protein